MSEKDKYTAVKIKGLVPCKSLDFDVYIYFPVNNKFIKYLHAHDHITQDVINKFHLRDITELYIMSTELNKYLAQMGRLAGEKIAKEAVTEEDKVTAAKAAAATILQNVNHLTNSNDVNDWTKNCIEVTQKIAEAFGDNSLTAIYEKLNKLLASGSALHVHSTTVCSIGTFLGLAWGISDPKSISDISLGGLIHDVGLASCKQETVDKYLRAEELTPQELKQIKEHPDAGMKLMEEAFRGRSFSENVKKILMEHHENAGPNGYPQKLPMLKQSLLPKIVAIADRISLMMVKEKNTNVEQLLQELYEKISKQEPVKELDDKIIRQILANLKENYTI